MIRLEGLTNRRFRTSVGAEGVENGEVRTDSMGARGLRAQWLLQVLKAEELGSKGARNNKEASTRSELSADGQDFSSAVSHSSIFREFEDFRSQFLNPSSPQALLKSLLQCRAPQRCFPPAALQPIKICNRRLFPLIQLLLPCLLISKPLVLRSDFGS